VAVLRIVRPPMVDQETYDAVNAELGGVAAAPPEGLIMHSAGSVNGAWQVVDVWESEEHARRFDAERLTPAIEAVRGGQPPSPDTTLYELHNLVLS
jgi:hypothetical protein